MSNLTQTPEVPTQPSPVPSSAVPPRTYCLNAGQTPPPTCIDGQHHSWTTFESPRGAYSGWHEERCTRCGIVQCYDTSD